MRKRALERELAAVEELVASRQWERVEEHVRRQLERWPGEPWFRVYLAMSVMGRDDPASAAEATHEIARAVALAPNDMKLLLRACQLMAGLDVEIGRGYGARAEALEPPDEDAAAMLAYVRGRYATIGGDQTSAEQYLREAVERDPRDPVYVEELVNLLIDAGRRSEAEHVSAAAFSRVFDPARLIAQRDRLGF